MIIDGKKIACKILSDLKKRIDKIKGRVPSLAFILVGKDPVSLAYVKVKEKACLNLNIRSLVIEFDQSITEKLLIKEIEKLTADNNIDAVLVQMPLPIHINVFKIVEKIDPNKDVDGFHPINVGKMLIGDKSGLLPCTPHGIKVMLKKAKIPIERKHVVIVGRSNIVGKPLAAMLMQKEEGCNATVTVAHSMSAHLKEITRSADILVVAIGKPRFITREMVKEGAVVVDVGTNRIWDENKKEKIVGDVDFENVAPIASHITPVPGGVGPMTVALLMYNTCACFWKNQKQLTFPSL